MPVLSSTNEHELKLRRCQTLSDFVDWAKQFDGDKKCRVFISLEDYTWLASHFLPLVNDGGWYTGKKFPGILIYGRRFLPKRYKRKESGRGGNVVRRIRVQ